MAQDKQTALVALGRRRDEVIERLSDAYAADAIEMDAFEALVDRAHQAATLAELDALIRDIEPVAPAELDVEPEQPVALATRPPERKRLLAIFGGAQRSGQWTVARKTTVAAVFGGVQLDFRQARLGPGVSELKLRAVMGGVDIIVPPDLAVEADGSAIFGGFDDKTRMPPEPDPARPLLRITGFAAFGGISVRTRPRKRRLGELPEAEVRRLPPARDDALDAGAAPAGALPAGGTAGAVSAAGAGPDAPTREP